MKPDMLPPNTTEQKNEDLNSLPVENNTLENNLKAIIPVDEKQETFIKIPLSEEELNMSTVDFAKKYEYTYNGAQFVKERGFRSIRNPNFISNKLFNKINVENKKKYIEEVTQLPIISIETAIGNEKEQKEIKKIVDIYDQYKHLTKYIGKEKMYSKKFRLLNGQELFFGDFVVLDRMIDLKMFRNNDGILMMFDEEKNNFTKFKQSSFFKKSKNQGFIFRDNFNQPENPKRQRDIASLESFSPTVFKLGFFKEEDFGKRLAGTVTYDTYGPHERMLSRSNPNVSLSNSIGRCIYYIGREKFVGTNKEINHETVRVSLLDNDTGVITDIFNGRKVILYTFPLIKKEEYEIKKSEIIKRRLLENKSLDKKNVEDNITAKVSLKAYSILNYIPKYDKESEVDYNSRISKLSDTSYVLGNFRSFMSETGLAANNYSWREQLILADALTSFHDKNKILDLGKNFGKDGIRTFISIEQGGEKEKMGDSILTLGETLPKDIAKKVFAKYGEIIDNVSKITEFTRTNFTKEIEINPDLIKKIEETLYLKGKQLLSQTYDDINDKKEVNYEDIGKQLDRINADTITTFAIFKQALKNGDKLSVESIEGSVFSKKDTRSIPDSQREEMSDLYDRNYKDHPDRQFIAKVKEYFNSAFIPEANKINNYFYTFEKDNKTRAFLRFEKQKNGILYASALNVDEASKNFGLGEAMMDEALSREAKENILNATCLISNPSNMRYFEKGFVSNHFKMLDNTNQFDLVWDEKNNINIISKKKSIEELISMYLKNNFEGSIEIKKEENLEKLHQFIPNNKALVRCFRDPASQNSWYAVYEKLPENYGLNTSEVV
jgi:hypothetical protein